MIYKITEKRRANIKRWVLRQDVFTGGFSEDLKNLISFIIARCYNILLKDK